MPVWLSSLWKFIGSLLQRPDKHTAAEGWATLVHSLQKNLKDAVARIDDLSDEISDLNRKLAECQARHIVDEDRIQRQEDRLADLEARLVTLSAKFDNREQH